MRAYIDSDVLIWHLRGERKASKLIRKLRDAEKYELWIGAMQRAEIVFIMRPEAEAATKLFLSQFKTATVDQTIIDQAGQLYRKWNPSHGVDINDTVLAATVLTTGGKIYCLNVKHYPFKDIAVQKAW